MKLRDGAYASQVWVSFKVCLVIMYVKMLIPLPFNKYLSLRPRLSKDNTIVRPAKSSSKSRGPQAQHELQPKSCLIRSIIRLYDFSFSWCLNGDLLKDGPREIEMKAKALP